MSENCTFLNNGINLWVAAGFRSDFTGIKAFLGFA
jgi:hypothetical protein